MEWMVLGIGLALGICAGAFIWTPLAIRENDRRWQAKLQRAAEWRERYPAPTLVVDDGWRDEHGGLHIERAHQEEG